MIFTILFHFSIGNRDLRLVRIISRSFGGWIFPLVLSAVQTFVLDLRLRTIKTPKNWLIKM